MQDSAGMPLTSAIQSAMAVRAERERRHQRRLSKIRRESGAGLGSGAAAGGGKRQSLVSVATLEQEPDHQPELRPPPDKVCIVDWTVQAGTGLFASKLLFCIGIFAAGSGMICIKSCNV